MWYFTLYPLIERLNTMHGFKGFVYLDVEKTGSTYVSKFLKETSKEKMTSHVGHMPVKKYKSPFYFISVRHPFQQYKSLYQYGCEGKGGLFLSLKQHTKADFYDSTVNGFNRWFEFMLDTENAHLLTKKYAKVNADVIGLNSFRFLRLGLKKPMFNMSKINNYSDIEKVFQENKFYNAVIKNETLSDDLASLAENQLSDFLDSAKVEEFLSADKKINTSQPINFTEEDLDEGIYKKMMKKERFLLDNFYAK